MSIEYAEIDKPEELTFNMVETDRFFYNSDGYLCQKINTYRYNTIADENGEPRAGTYETIKMGIKAICKKVVKISVDI